MKRSYPTEELSSVAKEVLSLLEVSEDRATVVAFYGELGAGKTTLVQAIATELGVQEMVTSPTFVIAKWYRTTTSNFYTLVHIDAYRIEKEEELSTLGFDKLLREPKALVIIEWPEKLPNTLSTLNAQTFTLHHEGELRVIEGPLPYESAK
ncbi:MAG: tRNA (adenosine(37)-N6)-threonylcarbamoyltransferase complex ATPase subunit type 1 TsaE [Patescibacteria group bacterium]